MSSQNLNEKNESFKTFGTADYAVFVFMLVVCSCVGLYFGYQDHQKHKKNKLKSRRGSEALDFLLGGKNIQVFPVAMSLVASVVSGVTLLGTSTEIYVYGLDFAYILVGPAIMGIFMHFIIIPVFYDLKVVSMFEYLQKRFDMRMRLFGSIIASLSAITWLPIAIYVPALAFNQTTGVDIHIIAPVVMAVCIFYTCLGGIKAVIWTDVIQVVIMYGVMALIVIKGTMDVGGLSVVIERSWESGRIQAPDFRTDPTIRHSFWTLVVGGSCYWVIANANQCIIQRFLALKDKKSARKGSLIYVVAVIILISMCIYNGMLLYATFHDCDPLTTKLAKAKDQLIPLLVMNILKDIPGLPGLFIAGVFSAALSSLSSALNSMSALVLEDYFKPIFKERISERASRFIMRGTVLVLGTIAVGLVYVVQHLGPVLQLTMSVPATCTGSLFGVFAIGMFLPWIGKHAAFFGSVIGSSIMIYVVTRAQLDIASGLVKHETKITSVEGCNYNFTMPQISKEQVSFDYQKDFHHVSYLYYMPLGTIITCMSAFILCFLFGFEDPNNVDSRLLAPFMRKYFESKVFKSVEDNDKDDDSELMLKLEMKKCHNDS